MSRGLENRFPSWPAPVSPTRATAVDAVRVPLRGYGRCEVDLLFSATTGSFAELEPEHAALVWRLASIAPRFDGTQRDRAGVRFREPRCEIGVDVTHPGTVRSNGYPYMTPRTARGCRRPANIGCTRRTTFCCRPVARGAPRAVVLSDPTECSPRSCSFARAGRSRWQSTRTVRAQLSNRRGRKNMGRNFAGSPQRTGRSIRMVFGTFLRCRTVGVHPRFRRHMTRQEEGTSRAS